jgi:sugar (pentulose or hexulose) kinase
METERVTDGKRKVDRREQSAFIDVTATAAVSRRAGSRVPGRNQGRDTRRAAPMSFTDTVLGLDIGTTTSKALIRRRDAEETIVTELPTPWKSIPGGGTEIHPSALETTVIDLIGRAVEAAEARWGRLVVAAISVAGLAESGILLDPTGRADRPAIAWFDSRGQAELVDLAATHPDFVAAFPGTTGLPWSAQAAFAKVVWLQRRRALPPGAVWLSVPEWIVHALGGDRVCEPSLASRTGLVQQSSGRPWDAALDLAGVSPGLLPTAVPAGTPVGTLDHPGAPASAAGALLSIAGHDHPVAALAADAVRADELFNSSGTADVLVRAVAAPITDTQRAAIVVAGWSAGAHIVPGTDLLLAGGSGGLLLRRVLAALGADSPGARDRLDMTSRRITAIPPGVFVRGDGRTQEDVEIRFRDGANPAVIWAAATTYTAELTRDMLTAITPIVGPHRRAVAAGGWTRMASVRKAKCAAIGGMEFCTVEQPGATGAALLAEYSLTGHGRSLTQFVHNTRRDKALPDPKEPG